jgi:predicted glutamine amidotransferase
MCIIIGKPVGVKLPPIAHIEESFNSNPHGFGCMWEGKKGKVQTYRTMDFDKCIQFYKSLLGNAKIWQNVPMSFHFRLATHGSKKAENCHAYTDEDKTIGFQHNGILSYTVPRDMDITDSEYFFRYLFLPVYEMSERQMNFDHVIYNLKGYSDKFSFIHEGKLILFGSFTDDNGCYYSNSSYKSYAHVSTYKPTIGYTAPIYQKQPVYQKDSEYGYQCAKCTTFDCMRCDIYDQ